MSELKMPLTNVQLELLKVFSYQLSEEELKELRKEIGKFFLHKAVNEADRVWDERGYSNELMERWLREES